MKHLRIYEDYNYGNKFWLLSSDPIKYNLSLKELKVTNNLKNNCWGFNKSSNSDKIYFGINYKFKGRDTYVWNQADREGYIDFIEDGYKYMGELELPEEVIAQHKFNL